MGFLWHSPSEGPLSRPFTIYTHRTSYTDLMHEGPSSYFSRFLELGVATSKYLSTPIIDYRGQRYPSPSWFALCSQGSNCRGVEPPYLILPTPYLWSKFDPAGGRVSTPHPKFCGSWYAA